MGEHVPVVRDVMFSFPGSPPCPPPVNGGIEGGHVFPASRGVFVGGGASLQAFPGRASEREMVT